MTAVSEDDFAACATMLALQFNSAANIVTITFINFAISILTLMCQLPVPLLPLLFTTSSITVILCTINSLSLNYPISRRSKTLLLVLSLRRLSPVISLPSYALHWLRITERIEYKLLSLTYKVLTTTQPPYLHNLISIQRPQVLLFIHRYSCSAINIILSKNN